MSFILPSIKFNDNCFRMWPNAFSWSDLYVCQCVLFIYLTRHSLAESRHVRYPNKFSLVIYKYIPTDNKAILYPGEFACTSHYFLLLFLSFFIYIYIYIPLKIFKIMYTSHWKFLECKEVSWYESILDFLGT